MKLSNKITRFQEGGAAPAPVDPTQAPEQGGAPAPSPEEGAAPQEDPAMQLVQMAQQALQAQDCQAAMAVCDGLLSLLSQGQGGGAPAEEPQGAPVYRKGGVLVRRIK